MTTRQWPPIAAALPAVLVASWSLGLFVSAVAGASPYWRAQPVNISEAAALRDAATVVQLLRGGADPSAAHRVREGVLFDRAIALTPLEAAVAARRAEVVEAILSERRLDAVAWRRAACLAASTPDDDIHEVVAAYRPDGVPADVDCAEYTRPW